MHTKEGKKDERIIAIGQRACFKNVAAYHVRHALMGGAAAFQNLDRCLKIFKDAQVDDITIREKLGPYIQASQLLKHSEIKEKDFGYLNPVLLDFRIDLIQELVKLPLEKVSIDFVRAYNSKMQHKYH